MEDVTAQLDEAIKKGSGPDINKFMVSINSSKASAQKEVAWAAQDWLKSKGISFQLKVPGYEKPEAPKPMLNGLEDVTALLQEALKKGNGPDINSNLTKINSGKAHAQKEVVWEGQAFMKSKGVNVQIKVPGYEKIETPVAIPMLNGLEDVTIPLQEALKNGSGPDINSNLTKINSGKAHAQKEVVWEGQAFMKSKGVNVQIKIPGYEKTETPVATPMLNGLEDVTVPLKEAIKNGAGPDINSCLVKINSGKAHAQKEVVWEGQAFMKTKGVSIDIKVPGYEKSEGAPKSGDDVTATLEEAVAKGSGPDINSCLTKINSGHAHAKKEAVWAGQDWLKGKGLNVDIKVPGYERAGHGPAPSSSTSHAPAPSAAPAKSEAPAAAGGVKNVTEELKTATEKKQGPAIMSLFKDLAAEKSVAEPAAIFAAQDFMKSLGVNLPKVPGVERPKPDITAELEEAVKAKDGPKTLKLMWTIGNKENTASKEAMWDANDLLEMQGILGPAIDGLGSRPRDPNANPNDINRELRINTSAKNLRILQMNIRDIVYGRKFADKDAVDEAIAVLKKHNMTIPVKDTRTRAEKEAEIEELTEKLNQAKLSRNVSAIKDLELKVKWRTEEMMYSEGEANYC